MSSGCKRCVFSKASQSKCSCGADYMASTAVNFHSNSQGTRPQRQKLGNVAAAFAAKLAETQLSSSKPSSSLNISPSVTESAVLEPKVPPRTNLTGVPIGAPTDSAMPTSTPTAIPADVSPNIPGPKAPPRAEIKASSFKQKSAGFHLSVQSLAEGDEVRVQRYGEWTHCFIESVRNVKGQEKFNVMFEDGMEQECQLDQIQPLPSSTTQTTTDAGDSYALDINTSLTSFDARGDLVFNEDSWKAQKEHCCEYFEKRKEIVARTVSFLGSTQAGKSTILKALLEQDNTSEVEEFKRPQLAEDGHRSTTCGVRTYPCMLGEEGKQKGVILIDVEGEDGTVPRETPADTSEILGPKARRVAVAKHLPRLAYCLSDIVMYVSKESFANATFVSRTLGFANAATQGVAHAEKPYLILISNKSDEKGLEDPNNHERETKRFGDKLKIESEDAADSPLTELRKAYAGFTCFLLPQRGMQFGGKDGNEVFKEKIVTLRNLIVSLMEKKDKVRKMRGDLYPPYVWWMLTRYIGRNFNSGLIRLSEAIVHAHIPTDQQHQRYQGCLLRRINRDINFEQYLIYGSAYLFASKALRAHRNFGEELPLALFRRILESAGDLLRHMLQVLTPLAPCRATFLLKKAGEEIPCTQLANCHDPQNHYSEDNEAYYLREGERKEETAYRTFKAMVSKYKKAVFGGTCMQAKGYWTGIFQLEVQPKLDGLQRTKRIKNQDVKSALDDPECYGKLRAAESENSEKFAKILSQLEVAMHGLCYPNKPKPLEIPVGSSPNKKSDIEARQLEINQIVDFNQPAEWYLFVAALQLAEMNPRPIDDHMCGICLLHDKVVEITCGHSFCEECYKMMAQLNRQATVYTPYTYECLESRKFLYCPFHNQQTELFLPRKGT